VQLDVWYKLEKKAMAKAHDDSSNHDTLYGQNFLIFYGALIGLIAGTLGALWSTLFFEYVIRRDISLEAYFWVVSLGFIITIVAISLWMLFFLRRSENGT
jgi:hypothetical protein